MLGSPTRTFICMDAAQRRDRLVGLLSGYGQFEVVGAEVANYRALRGIVVRHPGLVIMAPKPEGLAKAAWLTRRVHNALPGCAIVAAAGDGPDVRLAGQVDADRCLPLDAPLTDLIEAALHVARAHDGTLLRAAKVRPRAGRA